MRERTIRSYEIEEQLYIFTRRQIDRGTDCGMERDVGVKMRWWVCQRRAFLVKVFVILKKKFIMPSFKVTYQRNI